MKYLLLVCLVPLLLFSCKKKNDNSTAPNTFAFYATYDSIIRVPQYATRTFSFNVKVISGDISTNHLSCTITGLPNNVTIDPDTLDVGQLLGGIFTITTGNIATGYYPIELSITSKLHGTEIHKIALQVTQPFDFAPLLAGNYDSSYDFCQPGTFLNYSSVVSTVADTPFLLKMTNFKNLGNSVVVRGWVSNIVSIPMQTVGSQTIWGSGTYAQDARPGHTNHYIMSINDTLVTGLDTQTCVSHLQH